MFLKQNQMNRNETPTAPKVVDFGTLSDTHDEKHAIEKNVNLPAPQSRLFSSIPPLR